MKPFWYRLLFRNVGRPRGWVRTIFFHENRTARSIFYPFVHKKSGELRPHWAYWVSGASAQGAIADAAASSSSSQDSANRDTPSAAEQALRQLLPFDQTTAAWRRDEPLPTLLLPEMIVEQLANVGPKGIVLSASHDNYRAIPGGVQLCVQREERDAIAQGLAYLQFHPWQPLPSLAPEGDRENLLVSLILDGSLIGTTTIGFLTTAIERCVAAGRTVRLVVHHLLGHSPEALASLAHAAQVREVPFWLHDYFTLCPGYTLRRNDLAFCGAPDVQSNACRICVFGNPRPSHQKRIAAFFRELPIIAVAPSQVTAEFWSRKSDLVIRELAVIPHTVLEERLRTVPRPFDATAPVTVGFLGASVPHKGWQEFYEMMNRHAGPRMRFAVFSDKRPGLGEDTWRYVHVTAEAPDAMSKAIEGAGVDVVLHWASWPETFSFTTFEALSAGAWVLTNPVSGNVQATVRSTGRGAVLDDITALDRMFAEGNLARLVADRRLDSARTEIVARDSALSFDLPGWR